MERHDAGETRVIPIILRPVDWEDASFAKLQVLPSNGEPIATWPSGLDSALLNVTQGIRKIAQDILATQRYQEGSILTYDECYIEALTAFEEAIQLAPSHVQFYKGKGDALWYLHRYEEALEAYQQVVELQPNDTLAHTDKAWTLNNLRRYEEALKACAQTLQLSPTYAAAYSIKGWALLELEQYEEALEAYRQAIELKPDDVQAYKQKSIILEQLLKKRDR